VRSRSTISLSIFSSATILTDVEQAFSGGGGPNSSPAHSPRPVSIADLSIDGTIVEDPNAFDYRFATKSLGGTAQIGFFRQGKEQVAPINLQTAPELPREEIEIHSRSPFLGATVANLSPALADELRLDLQSRGVVIVGVADGSTAQSIGLQRGDVVVSVNNQKIEKSADVDRIVRAGSRLWRLIINRGGQQISATFSG